MEPLSLMLYFDKTNMSVLLFQTDRLQLTLAEHMLLHQNFLCTQRKKYVFLFLKLSKFDYTVHGACSADKGGMCGHMATLCKCMTPLQSLLMQHIYPSCYHMSHVIYRISLISCYIIKLLTLNLVSKFYDVANFPMNGGKASHVITNSSPKTVQQAFMVSGFTFTHISVMQF